MTTRQRGAQKAQHARAADVRTRLRARVALARGVVLVERRFVADVRGILRGVHELMLTSVERAGKHLTNDAVGGSLNYAQDIEHVLKHVLPQVAEKTRVAHVKMTAGVTTQYRASMDQILPVTWATMPAQLKAVAETARHDSIKYVEDAARVYAKQVRDVFGDAERTQGIRWEVLKKQLMERADVSESRAELIARDQTLKLSGAINQRSQQMAGVESYTWDTSKDERVRETHAALDGVTFSWAGDGAPDIGHPGEDFQCRCIAMPMLPGDAPLNGPDPADVLALAQPD